ncbi:MAG: hypothetical protein EU549_02710 [Promethearchaeota archaeon]|nr:MAG: hypothetical protein EU549_02710 [Candidatus Lokiarchaeota archaeon]
MEESEKQNLREMFYNTLDDLLKEKKRHPKFNKKLESLNVNVNLTLENIGDYEIIFKNGDYEILENERAEDAKLEITSTFENFFKYSSREINDIVALLTGKLKVKGKRHLFLLLKVGSLLKALPEKEVKNLTS